MGLKVHLYQTATTSVSGASTKSGLVIGLTSPQYRVISLVPTPNPPPATSPHRWAVEHAKLVLPMCPGGLSILGTYLPLTGTGSSPARHVQAAAAIALDVLRLQSASFTPIVLCRAPSGRTVAKEVGPNPSDTPRSADLRQVRDLAPCLFFVTATLSLPHTRLPVHPNFASSRELKSISSALSHTVASHAVLRLSDHLDSVVTEAHDSRTLEQIMAWPKQTKPTPSPIIEKQTLHAEIMVPVTFDAQNFISLPQHKKCRDTVFATLEGGIKLYAVVMHDSSAADVLNAIKMDFKTSFQARVDLLVDTFQTPADHDDVELMWGHSRCYSFPARVVASPKSTTSGRFPLSEYILSDESIDDDLKSRFQEIFSWDQETSNSYILKQEEQHGQNAEDEKIVPKATGEPRELASPDAPAIRSREAATLLRNSVLIAFIMCVVAIIIKQFT